MLGGSREMIDLVFEASIAEVMDEYFGDQRLHDAFFGGGVIGTWAGPRDRGTASVKLMHHQGDLDGTGSNWAYVEGGMGMVSFAIADAARDAGATLACGVPVARVDPGAGVELEDGTVIRARVVISNADPKVALELLGGETIDPSTPPTGSASRPGTCAAPSSSSTPLSTSFRTGPRPTARPGRPAR